MIHTDSEPDNFLTRITNREHIAFADATSDKGGVSVSLNRDAPDGPTFVYRMTLRGSLSEDQKSRLLASVANCPVRNTLSKSLHFTPGD